MSRRHARSTGALALACTMLLATLACGGEPSPLVRARDAAADGDRVRAIAHYREYLEEHPDDYDVRKEYAITLGEHWAYTGGDRRPVLDELERLYQQRPGDAQVQDLLSLMLVREGQAAVDTRRYEDAEALYERAVAVNPDAGTADYNLGVLYDEWGRPEEAFRRYRSAAEKRPPIPDLYLRLGRAQLQRGDPEAAVHSLEMVLELQGTSTYLIPQARCALARAHAAEGRLDEAERHLQGASADCEVPGLG